MIELYIENRKIDITDDLEINFTYESIDPDKLSSIKNSFSKTVNIPGTAANNITFGHIFRYDKYIPISGPSNIENFYDPHKKVNWLINKNGALVERGYCTLDNIIIKNERDITYQLTLYGGIGEFFYNLAYVTEDDITTSQVGSPKTLYDIFFDWNSKTTLNTHGPAMGPGEEMSNTLMKCSADIIAESYHTLNPEYNYVGTTYIDRDIVFVPCYTGLYEDFDSKHMLVSTFNQNYISSPLSLSTKNKLKISFPDELTPEGLIPAPDYTGEKYTTLSKTLSTSDAYRYGLVTFSRDLDPWEAGDLRVNELPVAIRLSKLLWRITQPENNGGYEVEWDNEILSSYYWKYGWVLLGKLKQTKEEITKNSILPNTDYDDTSISLNFDYKSEFGQNSLATQITYDLLPTSNITQGSYIFKLNVLPKLNFYVNDDVNGNRWFTAYKPFDWAAGTASIGASGHNIQNFYRWNTFVVINKFYIGGTLSKTICDAYYYTKDPENLKYGYTGNSTSVNIMTDLLKNKLETSYSVTIDKMNVHNIKANFDKSEGYWDNAPNRFYTSTNQLISTDLEIVSDTNIKIEQTQCICFTIFTNTLQKSGIWGVDSPDHSFGPNFKGLFSFFSSYNQSWDKDPSLWDVSIPKYDKDNLYNFSIKINDSLANGLFQAKSSGFNVIELDKKTLFAETQSPLKYLIDFCKLMNYRFICDNNIKKIQIMPLKKYYNNKIVNLDNRIDYGRNINIKNIVTKYKLIEFGLNTPDSYPVSLYNKISKNKFNSILYDTGIEYNATSSKLLDNLIYKNTIDWQQSSIFYNIYPQMPRPYSTNTISWTLWGSMNEQGQIDKKEFFRYGVEGNETTLLASADFLPKISLFDKDNKEISLESTLLFFNGFVKNYDYAAVPNNNKVEVQPNSINRSQYINSSGIVTSTQYQDIYIYNVQPKTQYFVTASFTSGYSSNIVNYCDSSGTVIGTEYLQTNANLVDAPLTIPSGTTTIRCNFRKTDTDAKMKVIEPLYAISPRVSFSNDTYEQYYLNDGRCYIYDFKYNDQFTSWGCYSSDQKGTASSWILPMFSRDLYNIFVQDVQSWNGTIYKFASWNFTNQEGLDSLYDLINTEFIINPNYNYSKTVDSTSYTSNEYKISEVPQDDEEYTDRIYDKKWKNYLNDLYDRNTRDITVYVDLSGLGDANSIMRNIYSYKSHFWIITKLENFKIAETVHDKFTKVTMHKIKNLNNWVN